MHTASPDFARISHSLRSPGLRTALLALTLALLGGGLGCSAEGGGDGTGGSDGGGSDSSGTGGGASTGGGSFDIDGDDTGKVTDERDVPVREEVCDAEGNCTCLRLALLGTLESAASNKDTQPFVDWLNGNSGGTAVVDMVSTKPAIDRAFLDQYDILLVANVNSWTFSQAEKDAVAAWSEETGGGIVTLTGFVSTPTEPAATSQLIQFSGLSYNSTTTAEGGQAEPVYFGDDRTTDRKSCLSDTASSDAIITTPIEFSPQTGALEPLTANLDFVGAFIGYGIDAPTDAVVVATDPMSGANMAVAKEVNAKGRVLAFGDEWVVFKNQWETEGTAHNQTKDENNVCWVPDGTDADGNPVAGYFHSVETLYQTKQFWYNALNWVAPPNECFVIEDDAVIIVR
jgi:hypothetical protein